MDEELKEQII